MQTKEWTLMFYFASDNPLASTIVSQLKALKDAGYHPDTNVIAHFDPHAVNTPVHVFDVNSVTKFWEPGKFEIGLGDDDAFVRDLVLDRLWGEGDEDIRDRLKGHVERGMNGAKFDPPKPYPRMSGEQDPDEALTNFLKFCRESYPAQHYLLFILGHGQVVGNDTLLYDNHANKHSLTLTDLGRVLRGFNLDLQSDSEPGELEMIVLHSCSMSSMEVAYELKGAANYMLASQGPMYVGNLPYKQILMRVFSDVEEQKKLKLSSVDEPTETAAAAFVGMEGMDLDRYFRETPKTNKQFGGVVENVRNLQNGDNEQVAEVGSSIKALLRTMFFDCLYNSYDFQLAGYPFDLCLTDLSKVSQTKNPINVLAESLINGLNADDPTHVKQLILLAHLDAQSFYQEDYVDLYDFCFCLKKRYEKEREDLADDEILQNIAEACQGVMEVLEKGDNNFIIRASFAGAAFQYSHGHSIYFPWKTPEDRKIWNQQYPEYRLTTETKWREFLKVYFEKTERATRIAEMEEAGIRPPKGGSEEEKFKTEVLALLGQIGLQALDAEGRLQKVGPDHPMGKYGPDDPSGASCTCTSIKNYPAHTGVIKAEKGLVRIHTNEDFLEGAPVPGSIRGS